MAQTHFSVVRVAWPHIGLVGLVQLHINVAGVVPSLPILPSTSPLPQKHKKLSAQPPSPPLELRTTSHNLHCRKKLSSQILPTHTPRYYCPTRRNTRRYPPPPPPGSETSKIFQNVNKTTRRGTALIFSTRVSPMCSQLTTDPHGLRSTALLRIPRLPTILSSMLLHMMKMPDNASTPFFHLFYSNFHCTYYSETATH